RAPTHSKSNSNENHCPSANKKEYAAVHTTISNHTPKHITAQQRQREHSDIVETYSILADYKKRRA
ncbi:MAG: hypothetical protein IIV83_05190, partial [Bacteroidales bacterium]|nr:hypothetical protein [Bacteroidales bacterium]